jgi:hypothetical protein
VGKYASLFTDVFSIFNAALWKAESIKTFPANFITVDPGNEYIRVSIIPSGRGINQKSASGLLLIDIFISAGDGPSRAGFIADKLDAYLVGKSIATGSNSTQMLTSSLSFVGVDSDNPSLYRANYSIPFNYFGVF